MKKGSPKRPRIIVPINTLPMIRWRSAFFWTAFALSSSSSSLAAASTDVGLLMPDMSLARFDGPASFDDGDHLAPAGDVVVGTGWCHGPKDVLLAHLESGLGREVTKEERIGVTTLPIFVLVADVVELPADLLEADLGKSEIDEDERNEQRALDHLDHQAEGRCNEDDPMQTAMRVLGSHVVAPSGEQRSTRSPRKVAPDMARTIRCG